MWSSRVSMPRVSTCRILTGEGAMWLAARRKYTLPSCRILTGEGAMWCGQGPTDTWRPCRILTGEGAMWSDGLQTAAGRQNKTVQGATCYSSGLIFMVF